MFKKATPTAKSRQEESPAKSVLHDEAIRRRAYEISLARAQSGLEGDALSDWLQAEREVGERGGSNDSARHAPVLQPAFPARRQGSHRSSA